MMTVDQRTLKNVCKVGGSKGKSLGQELRNRQSIKWSGKDKVVLETF